VDGVTYTSRRLDGTEVFVVVARRGEHVDWENRVSLQIVTQRVTLALEEGGLKLEVDGEHPKGGDITEQAFFDPATGAILKRRGIAR
jgi:hypothetical protein